MISVAAHLRLPILILAICAILAFCVPPALAAPIQLARANTGLVACWSFDEPGGVRYDEYGANNLTDNNTTGYAAGKVSRSALFIAANTEYLDIPDNTELSFNATKDMTAAGWIYLETNTGTQAILSKTGAANEYWIDYQGSNNPPRLEFRQNPSTNVYWNYTLSAQTWYHLIFMIQNNGRFQLKINNGNWIDAGAAGTFNDSSGNLYFGRLLGASYLNGRLDEWALWKRVITDEEATWLYNSGAGRECNHISDPTSTDDEIVLSSGNFGSIDRTITAGEIGIIITLGFIGLTFAISKLYEILQRSLP